MKGNEHIVFKTNQYPNLEKGIVLEVVRAYPTWGMRIQVLLQKSSQGLQRPEPKMLGKREKMGLAHHLY